MSKKILVADDDERIVQMLKVRLEGAGYQVVGVSDGKEAMEMSRREKPDLIVLDILMPNMDGYSFVRNMKSDEALSKIPVIIFSALGNMKSMLEMEGIKDFLTKPLEEDKFFDAIKKYVGE